MSSLATILLSSAGSLVARAPRLICSDVDGTLLNSRHSISEKTVSTVLRAMETTPFCACTGRARSGAYKALGPLGDTLSERGAPGVFLNGLIVYGPNGELLSDLALCNDVVSGAAAFAAANQITAVGFSGDRSLCEARDEWTDFLANANDPNPELAGDWSSIARQHRINKMLLLAPAAVIDELRPELSALMGSSASLTQAASTMLEVLPPGASKGAGVSVMLDRLGVDPADVLAIGDAENDIGMLELAGTSVAMGNASPEVKRAAKFTTAHNNEDGAALAFERHVIAEQMVAGAASYSTA